MTVKEKPKSKTPNIKPSKIKKPSIQQKKVLKAIMANVGSMKDALIKAGYSPNYAKNPQTFRKTATWQQLLDENIPDWLLTEKHLELFNAKTIDSYVFPLGMEDEDIMSLIQDKWGFEVMRISHGQTAKRAYFSIPDNATILKAVEAGYKIKNKYAPAEDTLIVRNYSDLPDEELERIYAAKVKRDTKKTND